MPHSKAQRRLRMGADRLPRGTAIEHARPGIMLHPGVTCYAASTTLLRNTMHACFSRLTNNNQEKLKRGGGPGNGSGEGIKNKTGNTTQRFRLKRHEPQKERVRRFASTTRLAAPFPLNSRLRLGDTYPRCFGSTGGAKSTLTPRRRTPARQRDPIARLDTSNPSLDSTLDNAFPRSRI